MVFETRSAASCCTKCPAPGMVTNVKSFSTKSHVPLSAPGRSAPAQKCRPAEQSTMARASGADMALLSKYETAHKRFLEAQSDRYARYMKAVKLLRASKLDDPAGLKGLDQFKRPRGTRRTAEGGTSTPAPAWRWALSVYSCTNRPGANSMRRKSYLITP